MITLYAMVIYSPCCGKIPDINNVDDEAFALAYDFRCFSHGWFTPCGLAAHHDGQRWLGEKVVISGNRKKRKEVTRKEV